MWRRPPGQLRAVSRRRSGRLLFDVNDFDETLRAPWEWDVKRLAASATVAARQNGFDEATAAEITRAGVRSYRERMATFAEMTSLDVFYAHVDAESALALSKTAKPRTQKHSPRSRGTPQHAH